MIHDQEPKLYQVFTSRYHVTINLYRPIRPVT